MKKNTSVPIAIVGIGCLYAKSEDLKGFFKVISRGMDAITDPPDTHSHLHANYDPDPKKPDHIYCNRGGFLPKVDFDPTEFGIPPTALEATDTSQLLGLIVAKQALRDAGYGDEARTFNREKTSVILGVTGTQELVIPLGARLGHPIWRKALSEAGVPTDQAETVIERISDGYVSWQESSFPGLLGNVVAGRIANRLDLGGTNCVVDAACASSMSALNLAMMELNSNRSDMVLAGGVDTISDAFMHTCFSKTHILSETGKIQPFSRHADGTLLGEGVGMVVLKRLPDAEKDGDRIYAVIKGLGSSSDGKSQSIYAPRQSGQALALRRAYQNAGVAPASVALLEAHGTGTRVGDQVEFQALCEVFDSEENKPNSCALGSVKSNIGHTKAAAGTAGLIKTALALYHKVLPPTLHAQDTDPNLQVAQSPFYINHNLRPWIPPKGAARIAGVSAFGFGGSNFHTVLEEYRENKAEPSWDGTVDIAAFSGDTKPAVVQQLHAFRNAATDCSDRREFERLTAESRQRFNQNDKHRLVLILEPNGETGNIKAECEKAENKLMSDTPQTATPNTSVFIGEGTAQGDIAFLFPGQGSQYVGMGRDLVCCFPGSLAALSDAENSLDGSEWLTDLIYPRRNENSADLEARLRQTQHAQPAIGAVSVAMIEALDQFGIKPDATCGHSYGELVALYAAGCIERDDLWRLSAERGRLMSESGKGQEDPGSMMAVQASTEALEKMVADLPGGQVVLANRNSPIQGVLSGPTAAIDAAEGACRERGWKTVRLPVAAAFHSALVSKAQVPFAAQVKKIAWHPGKIPVMSNTLGKAYPDNAREAQSVLGGQLAKPVDFAGNIETLYADGIRTFIEVGPKSVLTRLVDQILDGRPGNTISIDLSAGKRFGLYDMAVAVGKLAVLGYPVDLKKWEKPATPEPPKRMRIQLSGTNYRSAPPNRSRKSKPLAPKKHAALPKQAPALKVIASPAAKPAQMAVTPPSPKPVERQDNTGVGRTGRSVVQDIMKNNNNQNQLNQALATVQQSLSAMQALQAHTTQAHQKYLEAQTEASRTLQQMLQSTQQMASAVLNGAAYAPIVSEPQTVGYTPVPAVQPEVVIPAAEPLDAQPVSTDSTVNAGKTVSNKTVENLILSVVSELTGYPEEMLDLDMDIESDLGIDSIKRVEILSNVEERMPELPRVTPDMVGTLKTLAQICDFLSEGAPSTAAEKESARTDAQPSGADAARQASQVQAILLGIVSEMTGYPEEMLDLDMDIESDLGIDSIKRVEILSAVEEQMPELPKVTPDMVGTLKTLAQICDFLSGGTMSDGAQPSSVGGDDAAIQTVAQVKTPEIGRFVMQLASLPDNENQSDNDCFTPAPDHFIGVACGEQTRSDAIAAALNQHGCQARSLLEPNEIKPETKLAGLILATPMPSLSAFQWAKAAAPGLKQAAENGDALLCTVTQMDGGFGFKRQAIKNPEQGALAGLTKTAALEWPSVTCRCIDIEKDFSLEKAAGVLAEELISHRTPDCQEIGLSGQGRVGVTMAPEELINDTGGLKLEPSDVVLVSGGARGVTAESVLALAGYTPCTVALLGRSPLPEDEPEWLNGLTEEAQIKKAVLRHEFKNEKPSPKDLEAAFRKRLANRQVYDTLNRFSAGGIRAVYYAVDVKNESAVQNTVAQIRESLGPVRALIHGAGVLEDKLIEEKNIDQFSMVYDTKVKGLNSLLGALPAADLRYLVLFSSISARMGNIGQADYAMANEALNKIAAQFALDNPDCKVAAINWGPWDGGMVTPALKRNFEKSGITLIPISEGAAAMVAEMDTLHSNAVEVVIGGPLPSHISAIDDAVTSPSRIDSAGLPAEMTQTARREIDANRYPVLKDHRLGGRPVVPFALITEWLAHGALHANPGLNLHGIDDLRLLNGISLDQQKRIIRLMAGSIERRGEMYEVPVQICDDGNNGNSRIHSSARAILTDSLPSAPPFEENGHFKASANLRPLDEIYQNVLFHGEALRGIQKIVRLSDEGMTARVSTAPPPEQWLKEPLRSRWIADPLVLDCAFQMAIIWCHERQGVVCLPSYAASYRQYCDRFPANGVTAVLEVVKAGDRKMVGNFTFLDRQKCVIAVMKGYEAVIDQGLFKAFGLKAA